MRLPLEKKGVVVIFRGSILAFALAQACGCASFDEPAETPGPQAISILCTNNIGSPTESLAWQLQVVPDSIQSESAFSAELGGVMVFNESFLDGGQALILGGIQKVNVVDVRATVHVRGGAVGDDVTLEMEPIPYRCATNSAVCDPAHDLEGTVGLRGNTDCEPVGPTNACGRYILLPISSDCEPEGLCVLLGKSDQCALNGFCGTGDLRVGLQSATGHYVADTEGEVLFGWDDQSTGATLLPEGPEGPTWDLPPASYEEPTGPLGLRLVIGGLPIAFECTMGIFDVDRIPPQPIPAPDAALISFPIEPSP